MLELEDIELLREYAENNSETAFARLVERHVNLVYSVALRSAGDSHAAQEISQAVFIILAGKAKSLGSKTILSGWLYQTTRLTAANYLRKEMRRQKREQEAYMQSTLNESTEEAWLQIAPLLDDAISKLGARDRDTIVLRFFENKSLREVGAAIGASEDAAKMRVNRALEKLRTFFAKRGVASTAVIIAGTISANSVQAAPVTLAKTISAVAITKGAAASSSTLTLIKGALKIMAWTKAKTAIVAGVVVLLAAGTTTLAVKHQHQAKEPIPENSWAFAKYTTPEAAFQSSLWAMSKGDIKTVTTSYTMDFGNQFMETAGKGKSDNELVALFTQIASMIGDFQVVSNEVVSSDEAILHFRSSRIGNMSVPMKKIGNEWKINGNIASDEPTKGKR